MIARESLLIVDDVGLMRTLMEDVSKILNFRRVVTASSAIEALQHLRESSFTLVISDLNMKPMNGLDLLHVIRSDPRLAGVKFIMATVNSELRPALDARLSGADHYLLKPFKLTKLAETVDAVLGPQPNGYIQTMAPQGCGL